MQICEILAAGAPHWATQHIVTASRQQPGCQFVQPCRPNVACLSGFDHIGLAYSANSTGCNSSKSLSGTQDVELSFQDTRRLHLLVVHLGLCCLVRVITALCGRLSMEWKEGDERREEMKNYELVCKVKKELCSDWCQQIVIALT
jgi:hypothetical protein